MEDLEPEVNGEGVSEVRHSEDVCAVWITVGAPLTSFVHGGDCLQDVWTRIRQRLAARCRSGGDGLLGFRLWFCCLAVMEG